MAKNLNMTQGKPAKLLFAFALPLMFGNIFQQLYTVVDTAIVGQGVGMTALAALGTVDWLTWMMLGIAQGFTQGFSVRMSQKYGEGNLDGLKKIVGHSAVLSLVIAIIGTIVSQAGLPLFLELLHVPENLIAMAELYARIIMGGFVVIMFYNFCAASLRAIGDSKTPLKAMIVAALANIVLDILAVFVWGWGIAGAAGATIAAQCVAGAICAVKIFKTPELKFIREDLRLEKRLSGNLIQIGAPVAAKNIIIALGGMVVQTIVNGFGMSFIAGFTSTNKLYGLLEIAAISYGYAVTTYIGQNYGAKNVERIKLGMRAAVKLALATSVVISGIMIVFGRQITMLFISTEDPVMAAAAGNTAYMFLVIMSVCLPILYMLLVFLSALQGLGNTIIPMLSGIIELILRVSVALFVGMIGYENGIFWAESAAWTGAAVFLIIGYFQEMKKIKFSEQ